MKYIFLIYFVFIIFSCTNSKNNIENNKSTNIENEDFNSFFEHFIKDSLFQNSRIDHPVILVNSDDEKDNIQSINVEYVSFKQKDWKEKIIINRNEISPDTINVTLEGSDTGLFINHFFVKRNNQWFLFRINNESD